MRPKAGRKGSAFVLLVIILMVLLIILAIYWNIYVYQGGAGG